MESLIKAVREHARKNYNSGGWDYVLESFDDADLIEAIGDAQTIEAAIAKVGRIVALHNEKREEAQSFIF